MSNAIAMTEETQQELTESGPNLMVLKGIVWGLGVLILMGLGLVAWKISPGPVSTAPREDLALVIEEGDRIVSSSMDNDQLIAVIERDGMPHRIMIVDMRTNEVKEIPVERRIP